MGGIEDFMLPPFYRPVLPHPDPLPLGEGIAMSALDNSHHVRNVRRLTTILPFPKEAGRSEGEVDNSEGMHGSA